VYYELVGEKATGIILLIVGLAIIVFASFSAYQVFLNRRQPVKLFNTDGIYLDLSDFMGAESAPQTDENEQTATVQVKGPLKTQIVEPSLLNFSLNLAAYLVIMGFFVNVGFKVASLGVQFLRPIKVKVREQSEDGKKTWR
jgi:hypothetical protein